MSDSINSHWIYTTMKIENEQQEVGTSFLLEKTKKGHKKIILVTNKHVIHKELLGRKAAKLVYLNVNVRENGIIVGKKIALDLKLSDQSERWVEHPNNDVDVLAIDITDWIKNIPNLEVQFVSLDSFADQNLLKHYGITMGREISVIGYPLDVKHADNNIPMTINGSISSSIGDYIEDKIPMPNGGVRTRVMKAFLVDGSASRGNSGSPVVLRPLPNIYGGEKETLGKQFPTLLLGIISHTKHDILSNTNLGDFPSHSGLAIAFDADNIKETIMPFCEEH